jgi:hypothetical protein
VRRIGSRLALAGVVMLLAGPAGAQPRGALSSEATRAYDLARSADETAGQAQEEAERSLKEVQKLVDPERAPVALREAREAAEAAGQAVTGYRRQAQAAATEALQLLAEVARLQTSPKPDPLRRGVLEQRALLTAYEAQVMAVRARADAERLRAILAETRAAQAGAGSTARAAAPPPAGPAAPVAPVTGAGTGGVEVPNLIGARLDAATRDLQAAGLRLGGIEGPREGFVVKQAPEAGMRAARDAAVSVTLSGSAATTSP